MAAKLDNLTLLAVMHHWLLCPKASDTTKYATYNKYIESDSFKELLEHTELFNKLLVYLRLYRDIKQLHYRIDHAHRTTPIRRMFDYIRRKMGFSTPYTRLLAEYNKRVADAEKAYKDYEFLRKLSANDLLLVFMVERPDFKQSFLR